MERGEGGIGGRGARRILVGTNLGVIHVEIARVRRTGNFGDVRGFAVPQRRPVHTGEPRMILSISNKTSHGAVKMSKNSDHLRPLWFWQIFGRKFVPAALAYDSLVS